MPYDHLFQPLMLGKVEVRNRVALAPMGLGLHTHDDIFHPRVIRFVEERARGGAGLIISNFVHAKSFNLKRHVGIYHDRFIPSHKKYVEVCHRHGAKVFLQIASYGGKGDTTAPSAIDSPLYQQRPVELTAEEILSLIDDFILAAGRACEAGHDGVELHGSHGYLIEQFISPHSNKRSDEFGGDFERRMKVPVSIIQGIHKLLGADFPVGFKFSAWEEVSEGIDFKLAKNIAGRVVQENPVYIHVAATSSTIHALSDYPSVPPLYVPHNTLLPLAENIREETNGVPLIITGAIVNPKDADTIISEGKADMVAVGRAMIADPFWINNAKAGTRYRPCIRCNWCHDELFEGRPVRCSVNPYVLWESREPLQPASRLKTVMVAGGGPAGHRLAARVLSREQIGRPG